MSVTVPDSPPSGFGFPKCPGHRAVLPDTELLPELELLEPRSS